MSEGPRHLTTEELEAGMHAVRRSPRKEGSLDMIVARPQELERIVLDEGELDLVVGLVGDNWSTRGCRHTPDGSAHPGKQLNVMNSRAISLVAGTREHWPLAGDQLFIDLDLSEENVPAGTRIAIGATVIEVTDQPHRGCKKFVARYGLDAMKFVNSPVGAQMHLRGISAKVVQPGVVRTGDPVIRK